MSNSFYVRCQDYLDLEAIQQLVQRHFGQEMELCLNRGDRDYGGLFYIKGQSTCGVEVCKEDDDLVVRLPLLADYADFFLAKLFLDIFKLFGLFLHVNYKVIYSLSDILIILLCIPYRLELYALLVNGCAFIVIFPAVKLCILSAFLEVCIFLQLFKLFSSFFI